MALALNPRAERLLARLPRIAVYTVLELVLLVLLAVQCARLFWSVLTPLGPVGAYRTLSAAAAPATLQSLGSFDPFFRQAPGAQPAQAVVTSLNIRLYGTSQNSATGGGTAIVAGPDGVQRSVAVGEEIMPGVTLAGVGFDFITLDRGGATEQLFIDQSTGAPGQPGAPPPPGMGPQPGTAPGTTMSPQPVPANPPAAAPVQPAPIQPGNQMQPQVQR